MNGVGSMACEGPKGLVDLVGEGGAEAMGGDGGVTMWGDKNEYRESVRGIGGGDIRCKPAQ